MRQIPIETNLLDGLRARAAEPGPRVLVAPPGHDSRTALVTLILDEARGYREAELEVARRRLAALDAEWDELLQGVTEFDTEPRTGARIPVLPIGHAGLELARTRAREYVQAAEQQLAAVTTPDAATAVTAVLAEFDLQPSAALAGLRAADRAGQLVVLYGNSWALLADPDERLAMRRMHLGLPPEQDWWEQDQEAAPAP
jgi:hypothetical protein